MGFLTIREKTYEEKNRRFEIQNQNYNLVNDFYINLQP